MKTALSAIALATALTLAPFIGGGFAVADDSAQRQEHGDRFTPEDRAAFVDISPSKESSASPPGKNAATTIRMGRGNQPGRPPRPRFRALERARRRPAKTGLGREASLRQPGRRPEAPVRGAFPWVHGSRPRAPLAPRRLTAFEPPTRPPLIMPWRLRRAVVRVVRRDGS
jgi:hypothetical protein